MSRIIPRHVLCVLGTWRDFGQVEALVRQCPQFELDQEFSQLAPDPRMTTAFEASYDRVRPSMTDEDWQAVREHNAVAYVLSPPLEKELAMKVSGHALLLTAVLLRNGGVAAKGESAGIAHGRDEWLKLAKEHLQAAQQEDAFRWGSSLYWAWVRGPLHDAEDGVYYTCGMHLLGERDIEIDASLELDDALRWLDLLGLYLAGDRPERPLLDGEGFRLRDEGPRRIIRLLLCQRYPEDSFMFNPYGYIRLEAE